jgi:hypothetical protein
MQSVGSRRGVPCRAEENFGTSGDKGANRMSGSSSVEDALKFIYGG